MRLLFLGSIRRSLLVLVLMALLPSLVILLYSGRELRSRVVLDAEDYTLRQVNPWPRTTNAWWITPVCC